MVITITDRGDRLSRDTSFHEMQRTEPFKANQVQANCVRVSSFLSRWTNRVALWNSKLGTETRGLYQISLMGRRHPDSRVTTEQALWTLVGDAQAQRSSCQISLIRSDNLIKITATINIPLWRSSDRKGKRESKPGAVDVKILDMGSSHGPNACLRNSAYLRKSKGKGIGGFGLNRRVYFCEPEVNLSFRKASAGNQPVAPVALQYLQLDQKGIPEIQQSNSIAMHDDHSNAFKRPALTADFSARFCARMSYCNSPSGHSSSRLLPLLQPS